MAKFPEPLGSLGVIRRQHVRLTPDILHEEIYCWDGLLTLYRHGPAGCRNVLLTCGGALGGTLGPANSLYYDLANRLNADHSVASIRVGYRRPNDLDACTQDMIAAAEVAATDGAEQFVVLGHSFGGAVAIQTGVLLADYAAGVVTLATQSAGCEDGDRLVGVPTLHLHGDRDEVLPHFASEMVQMITGGELVILAGATHGLGEAAEELRTRLMTWIPERFNN